MTLLYNKSKQREKRRQLRKNATIPEKILWSKLKGKQLGVKFRRQYGIGKYIADFCSVEIKLIIEIDGGIHDDKELMVYDDYREETVEEIGFKVIRFTNEEVESDIDLVIRKIKNIIKPLCPSGTSPLVKGRETVDY